MKQKRWVGVAALVACAAMWSLNGPLIKILTAQHVPGVTIACYRSLIGGALFVPFAFRYGGRIRGSALAWAVASIFTFTLMTASFVIATTQTAAANAIILQYTSPVWVFLLAPLLLRERPRPTDGVAMLIAMVGVSFIFLGQPATQTGSLLIALLSGLGYGALTVVLRGLRTASPILVACLNCLGSGLLLVPAVALWGSFVLTHSQWGLVIFMSVAQFALPYVLFSWALRRVEAPQASLIVLLETVFNPLLTYFAVHETPPTATLIGGPLILLGVVASILLSRGRRSAGAAATTPEVPAPAGEGAETALL